MVPSPDKKQPPTKHVRLKTWVSEMASLCKPDRIVWIDG